MAATTKRRFFPHHIKPEGRVLRTESDVPMQKIESAKKIVERLQEYGREKQERMKLAEKEHIKLELKNCTGCPQINKKSKEMFSDVKKMINWECKRDQQKSEQIEQLVI